MSVSEVWFYCYLKVSTEEIENNMGFNENN